MSSPGYISALGSGFGFKLSTVMCQHLPVCSYVATGTSVYVLVVGSLSGSAYYEMDSIATDSSSDPAGSALESCDHFSLLRKNKKAAP